MAQINPEILRWARETAGLTLEEASNKLNILEIKEKSSEERLQDLETGETEPSRSMLLKMAKLYRRSLLVFYLDKPPRKADRGQDFRTLPDNFGEETKAQVDALIRNIQVRQSILRSALEDEEDTTPVQFVDSLSNRNGVAAAVEAIQKLISFDLNIFRDQPSTEDAFKYLRLLVENTGVFVLLIGDLGSYHTAFDLELFRGLALSDEIAPFIVINDRDSHAAWSFTLIHELVHIGLGQTGISSTSSELQIEQFCNQVASELLLPGLELGSLKIDNNTDYDVQRTRISEFANAHNLSNSMVAYKLYLNGYINKPTWDQLNRYYREFFLEGMRKKKEVMRQREGGPSYYMVRRHRLGENLISLVHQMIVGGTLTTVKAGKVLGVAPKNVRTLIESKSQMHSR